MQRLLQMLAGVITMGQLGMEQVIAGMHSEMLLQVKCKCACLVFFNIHFLVGFRATMMEGTFVMHCRGMTSGTLCSADMSVTLCSLGLTVSGHWNRWGSSAGRILLCRGCVCTSAEGAKMLWEASLLRIKVITHCCFIGVIAFIVMTILSDNPLGCFVLVRHGTWCC
jgi:hypothetical protein